MSLQFIWSESIAVLLQKKVLLERLEPSCAHSCPTATTTIIFFTTSTNLSLSQSQPHQWFPFNIITRDWNNRPLQNSSNSQSRKGNIEVFVMNMRMFRQRKPPPSYTFIAQYIRLHIIQLACFCLPSITIVHDVILALGLRTFWQHCNNNGTKTMFLFLTMSGQSS